MRQSIARVAIVVPGYDEGIAFYCGKLGFDLLEDNDLGGGKRWVVVRPKGATETALLLARAEGERQRAAIGNQTGGRVGFFLFTDDFSRDHAAMDSCIFSGMIISKTTKRREWRGWRLAFWRVLAYLIPTGTNPRIDSLER